MNEGAEVNAVMLLTLFIMFDHGKHPDLFERQDDQQLYSHLARTCLTYLLGGHDLHKEPLNAGQVYLGSASAHVNHASIFGPMLAVTSTDTSIRQGPLFWAHGHVASTLCASSQSRWPTKTRLLWSSGAKPSKSPVPPIAPSMPEEWDSSLESIAAVVRQLAGQDAAAGQQGSRALEQVVQAARLPQHRHLLHVQAIRCLMQQAADQIDADADTVKQVSARLLFCGVNNEVEACSVVALA